EVCAPDAPTVEEPAQVATNHPFERDESPAAREREASRNIARKFYHLEQLARTVVTVEAHEDDRPQVPHVGKRPAGHTDRRQASLDLRGVVLAEKTTIVVAQLAPREEFDPGRPAVRLEGR